MLPSLRRSLHLRFGPTHASARATRLNWLGSAAYAIKKARIMILAIYHGAQHWP
jgi:plasmid stabilization system protein ParE